MIGFAIPMIFLTTFEYFVDDVEYRDYEEYED